MGQRQELLIRGAKLQRGYVLGGALEVALQAKKHFSASIEQQKTTTMHLRPSLNQSDLDQFFMAKALAISMQGCGVTAPNPAVGCVLVAENAILATGCTQAYGGAHAERMAFSQLPQASVPWSKVTAYVTLEPCSHQGKQPPCVDLFLQWRPARVVVACADPYPLVGGDGLNKLRAAGVTVDVGVMATEAQAWNYPFFVQHCFGRPMIAAKWAQSLDGCFADAWGNWRWISCNTSRRYTHWLRQKYDAILVGAGTVLHDIPKLDARETIHDQNRQPIKMLFDPRAKILEAVWDPNLFAKLKERTFAEGSRIAYITATLPGHESTDKRQEQAKALLKELCQVSFYQIPYTSDPFLELKKLLCCGDFSELNFHRPLQSLLVEGGPTVLQGLIANDSIDAYHIFQAPFFLGGGISLTTQHQSTKHPNKQSAGYFPRQLQQCEALQLMALEHIGNDILAEYVPYSRCEKIFSHAALPIQK